MLVDVHAHLDSKELLPDIKNIIKKCLEARMIAIINNGVDHTSNLKTIEISDQYSIVKPSLGLFPTIAENLSEKEIDAELKFIEKLNPFAIGEVGLDFFRGKKKEKQIEIFKKIIKLAKKIKKPLIVHSRNAEKEVIKTLIEEKAKKVILHCFSGKKNLIHEAIKNNFYFSIPPNIVRNEHFKNLVKEAPISLLLTETDCPYLGPEKEELNFPMNVIFSIKEIARIKHLDEEEVEKMIYMNFQRAFL